MASIKDRDAELVEQFVATFTKFDDMTAFEKTNPVGWQLVTEDCTEHGFHKWRPKKLETAISLLDPIYSKLPAHFPPLFEVLVLSYRWAEVDLESYRLLPNPLGADLTGLLQEMSKDRYLWKALLPAGYVQFGRGPDIDYDPVCFDIKSRKKNRDCRVVKIDHEQILCYDRVRIVAELAPSFYDLVRLTIERAATKVVR